jgi:hypothetical protein
MRKSKREANEHFLENGARFEALGRAEKSQTRVPLGTVSKSEKHVVLTGDQGQKKCTRPVAAVA